MTNELAYTVRGRYPFPADMLRRDRSRPATEADRERIALLSRDLAEVLDGFGTRAERRQFRAEVHEINLVIPDAGRFERPLTERWESMGWSVPGDAEHAARKDAEAELVRLRALDAAAAAKLSPEEYAAVRALALREVRH